MAWISTRFPSNWPASLALARYCGLRSSPLHFWIIVWSPATLFLVSKWTILLRAFTGKQSANEATHRRSFRSKACFELYFGRNRTQPSHREGLLVPRNRLNAFWNPNNQAILEDQQVAYFAMRQELQDFRDAHYLRIGRCFFETPMIRRLTGSWRMSGCVRLSNSNGHTSQRHAIRPLPAIAKGMERLGAFWHVGNSASRSCSFHQVGASVLASMLWSGIRPGTRLNRRERRCFAQFDPAITPTIQGQTPQAENRPAGPARVRRHKLAWLQFQYDSRESSLAKLLINGGAYEFQVVEVNGEKTGGKPDLFKLFLERFHQLLRPDGRAGILMPAGLYALEGATGVRRMLFSLTRVEAIYSFENWGKRFFQIHASFKFPRADASRSRQSRTPVIPGSLHVAR